MKKSFVLLITVCICSFSLAQKNKAEGKDTLYIMIPKNRNDFTMKLNNDSTRVSVGILKHNYRTKQQRQKYFEKLKKEGIAPTSFYYSFYGFYKPARRKTMQGQVLTPIDKIAKGEMNINYETRVFFVERLSCNRFLLYETRMDFEE